MADPKSVTLFAVTAFKIEGEHVAQGSIVKNVEAELAKELAGAGRARMATDDDVAAAAKAAKATQEEMESAAKMGRGLQP